MPFIWISRSPYLWPPQIIILLECNACNILLANNRSGTVFIIKTSYSKLANMFVAHLGVRKDNLPTHGKKKSYSLYKLV